MPRWFLAFLFTVVLSSYGAASFGQVPANALQTMVQSASQSTPQNSPDSVEHHLGDQEHASQTVSLLQAESFLDGPELFDTLQAPVTAAGLRLAGRGPHLLSLPRPFLAGLERPPRLPAGC